MTEHTNEELLDVFIAARSLADLHKQPGGIEISRKYYEQKASDYRKEIIRRMGAQE